MRRLLGVSVIAAMLLAVTASTASASYCGALRSRSCKQSCCQEKCTSPCQCCYTVMRMCRCVEYDYEEMTLYKTVYEEVIDKHTVCATKYVEGVDYRCCPCTDWQPGQPCACGPVDCCGKESCCVPPMEPTCYLRRVPRKTLQPECYEKTIEKPRVVVKQVPYTVTKCIPRVVCKEVPVTICCPMPSCCCCQPSCSDQGCCD